jgi:hypothetical protein
MTFSFSEALGRIKMLCHLQSLVSIQKGGKVVMYDRNVTTDERDSCLFILISIFIYSVFQRSNNVDIELVIR